MPPTIESQLLDLTRQLLTAIADRDWKTYSQLCDPSLTCFEPEAVGQMIEGMDFHKFYFDLQGGSGPAEYDACRAARASDGPRRGHRQLCASAPEMRLRG